MKSVDSVQDFHRIILAAFAALARLFSENEENCLPCVKLSPFKSTNCFKLNERLTLLKRQINSRHQDAFLKTYKNCSKFYNLGMRETWISSVQDFDWKIITTLGPVLPSLKKNVQ